MEKNKDWSTWLTTKGHKVEYESCSANLSSIQGLPVTQDTGVYEAPAEKSRSENIQNTGRIPDKFEDKNATSSSECCQQPQQDEEVAPDPSYHNNDKTGESIPQDENVKTMEFDTPPNIDNSEDLDARGENSPLGDHKEGSSECCQQPQQDAEVATTTEDDQKLKSEAADNPTNLDQEDKRKGHCRNCIITLIIMVLIIIAFFKVTGNPTLKREPINVAPINQDYYVSAASDIGLLAKDLHDGNMLAIRRCWGLYNHYVVYMGNGSVMHLTGGTYDKSKFIKGRVKRDKLVNVVAQGDYIRIENGTWEGKEPLPTKKILQTANSKDGEIGYNLFNNNCEHFARLCRYGESVSYEANWLLSVIIYSVPLCTACAVSIILLYYRKKKTHVLE